MLSGKVERGYEDIDKTPFDDLGSMADKKGKPIVSKAPPRPSTTARYVAPTTRPIYIMKSSAYAAPTLRPSPSVYVLPIPSSTARPLPATAAVCTTTVPSSSAVPRTTVVYGSPFTPVPSEVPSSTAAPVIRTPIPEPTTQAYVPPAATTEDSDKAANTRAADTEISGSRGLGLQLSLLTILVPLLLAL